MPLAVFHVHSAQVVIVLENCVAGRFDEQTEFEWFMYGAQTCQADFLGRGTQLGLVYSGTR